MSVLAAFIAGLATGLFASLGGGYLGLRFAQTWSREDDDA